MYVEWKMNIFFVSVPTLAGDKQVQDKGGGVWQLQQTERHHQTNPGRVWQGGVVRYWRCEEAALWEDHGFDAKGKNYFGVKEKHD